MADFAVTFSGWDRAFMASEKVKERLQRSTAALEKAGVAYAVVGGNAVAAALMKTPSATREMSIF